VSTEEILYFDKVPLESVSMALGSMECMEDCMTSTHDDEINHGSEEPCVNQWL
jgi:hypothetical protein